ncbi:MAG TPA: hypothetical protein VKE51_13185 [Vicinamibacterales bacterium]|nr:hypothetical protein [Vicinamibacterales bacterium]
MSGEAQGGDLAWYLTSAVYDALKREGREPVLMNPGGAYTPLDDAATLAFARSAGVGVVVQSRLAPAQRSSRRDDHPRLQVDVKVLDVRDGAALHAFSVTKEVNRKDLDRGFDFGAGFDQRRFLWIPGTSVVTYHDVSRRIEKQPLGKTINGLADAIRSNVLSFGGATLVYPSAALHPNAAVGTCEIEFAVRYLQPRSTSRAYALVVNGREESEAVDREGVAHLIVNGGSNLFEVVVKDPPFKLPVQRGYAVNRWMACTADERSLSMEIGASGEALVVAGPDHTF